MGTKTFFCDQKMKIEHYYRRFKITMVWELYIEKSVWEANVWKANIWEANVWKTNVWEANVWKADVLIAN